MRQGGAAGSNIGGSAAILTLVAAMAVQNAAQRLHLGAMPPTTIMTSNTTQAMIDVVDLLRGLPPKDPARRRLAGMAALLFVYLNMWCFMVSPLLALMAVMLARDPARP